MDLAKFADLVQRRELFFTRAPFLGDPYEGSITKAEYRQRQSLFELAEQFPDHTLGGGIVAEKLAEMERRLSAIRKQELDQYFVSCWHESEYESAAMWASYGGNHASVSIQSTFKKMKEALPSSCLIGKVKYVDWENDIIPSDNVFNSIMHKRRSFAHESEVRAVAWGRLSAEHGGDLIREKAGPRGVYIPIDLNSMVEDVYIAPLAPEWFFNVARELARTYGLAAQVKQSSLAGEPLY
jgi:hypothetical protein